MKNLTPELIAKAKTAESAEKLFEIAKENGVELTAEDKRRIIDIATVLCFDKLPKGR